MLKCCYTLPSFPYPLPGTQLRGGVMLRIVLYPLLTYLDGLLFFITFSISFLIDVCPIFDPNLLPKSTKIAQKSMPRCLPMLNSFFDRFLIDFCSQLGPPEPKKSSPRCRESTIFQKIAFRKWHRFLIDFGANMAHFGFQNPSKSFQKSIPRCIKFLIDFDIDF